MSCKEIRARLRAGQKRLARPGSKLRMFQDAGLSLHQYRQAVRVANLPEAEFERLVESDDPPSIEQLANLGRRRAPGGRPARMKPCPTCGGTGKVDVAMDAPQPIAVAADETDRPPLSPSPDRDR